MKKNIILGSLILFMIVLDQLTKLVVIDRFSLGESIEVIPGYFNLTYVRNTGAAFGMLADAHPEFRVPFFLIVPVIALGVVYMVYRKLPKEDWRSSVALALIAGGAVGNLIDRGRLGFVVDFLDFHWRYQAHFPAFNVADSAITVGVGLILLDMFLQKQPQVQTSQTQ